MFNGYDIVCIAPCLWDESWLDVHRYMLLLAQSNRVLLVERAVTPISFLTPGQRQFVWQQVKRSLSSQIREITTNVYVVTPPLKLPLRYEDPVLRVNHFFLQHWLKSVLKALGMSQPIVWFYEPDAALLNGHLNELASLYMVTDDYATTPSSLNRASKIRHWEQAMLKQVDIVVASEECLAAARRIYNPNTHYVAHGVDYDLFSRALDPELPVPDELAHITKPIVGFVGRINQRIDLRLIEAILQQDWALVMVGQVGDDKVARQLAALPDVILTGYKTQTELPAYLKSMDVCIIPYGINDYTRHMHPLKALEYLAAGKVIVSTPLPALKPHQEMITFASTPHDFITAITNAIETDSDSLRHERSRYTASMTWAARLEEICGYIEAQIQGRTAR